MAEAAAPKPSRVFENLKAGKQQTIVAYGTSLTAAGAWTVAVKQWFEEQYPGQTKFINSGGPGQNSDWGVQNLKAKVLDHKPDLVFLEFSYNDAHEKFKMSVEKGASNLETIVEAILKQNPDAAIILQTMNLGWDVPNGNQSYSVRPTLDQYNENYRSFAASRGLPLLDHYQSWVALKQSNPEKFRSYIPDGSHPSKEGSLTINWANIRAWLEKARADAKAQPGS